MSKVIALMTDFGLQDSYVGMMKAVIAGICPGARVIDITHAIKPQNVRGAAFALLNSYRYFPAGAVFCVVVDPGVGSERLAIAVKSGQYHFVGPDNGVLSYALARLGAGYEAVALEAPGFQADAISQTFHGRDIFAPAAAQLAQQPEVFAALGGALASIVSLPQPELDFAKRRVIGEVMHIDRFGNVISSIGAFEWLNEQSLKLTAAWGQDIAPLPINARGAQITVASHRLQGIARAYHEVAPGEILALIDSSGFLEISLNQGNAARRLSVQLGDEVMLRLR